MATLIPGPPLCGFFAHFESAYGRADTETDMPTVTPSRVGNSLLPWRCPSCGAPMQELACPHTRKMYCDTRPGREGICWCPRCNARFRLDERGVDLPCDLKAGAEVGPSLVTRGGASRWQDGPGLLQTLGAVLLLRRRPRRLVDGYWLLARAPRRLLR